VAPIGAKVLSRMPLEFWPRATTTLNYERLKMSDPALKQMGLNFVSNVTRFEDGVFLRRLPWIFFLCGVQLVAAAVMTPPAVLAVFCIFPAIVFGLLTIFRGDAEPWFRGASRGLLLAAFAYAFQRASESPNSTSLRNAFVAAHCALLIVGVLGILYRFRFVAAHPDGASLRAICGGWLKDEHTWTARDELLFRCACLAGAVLLTVITPIALGWWSSFFLDHDRAFAVSVILTPVALAVLFDLKRVSWQFLVHDPNAMQAPGFWIGSRLTAPQRRALAFTALMAVQAATIACLMSDAAVREPLIHLRTSSDFVTAPVMQTIALLTFVAVVVPLAALAPFSTLDRVHTYRHKQCGRSFKVAVRYNLNLQFSDCQMKDADGNRIREADHIFFGVEPFGQFPVLLHRPLIREHMYISGDSGSGKTSQGLIPLLFSLIGFRRSRVQETAAIVIVDLKGDMACFEAARRAAARVGKSFRYFTPEQDRSSYFFNALSELNPDGQRTPMQLTEVLQNALSLNHGEGYGRLFFSRKTRAALLDALNRPTRAKSLRDLLVVLERIRGSDPTQYRDVFELISTVKALTSYPQLNTSGSAVPEQTIHMPSVIEDGQVVYFWLPSAIESASVREIAKLALYSLLAAAMDRARARGPNGEPLPPRQTYLFIDEFQRIAGENFKVVLEQARSFNVGVILSNQGISELKTPDSDLRSVVRTNTRVKVHFSIQNRADLIELSDLSGLDAVENQTTGWSVPDGWFATRDGSRMSSTSYTVKPRLTPSDLQEISDHPHRCVLHVSRGSGLSQFGGRAIPVQTGYVTESWTYARDSVADWPNDVALPQATVSPVEQDQIAHIATAEEQRQVIKELFADVERPTEVTHADV
jgi:hypothetical protein